MANVKGQDVTPVTSAELQAFTGSMVVDFSGNLEALPLVGDMGSILVGHGESAGPVIGAYSVVPEPSTVALGLAGAGVVFALRRRFCRG